MRLKSPDRTGPDGHRRYNHKYLGFVRDNIDPERRGRVRVHCPEVMGEVDSDSTWLGWAESKALGAGFDQGLFFVPSMPDNQTRDPGDSTSPYNQTRVWVEFRDGDPSKPIYDASGPWVGGEEILNHAPILTDADNGGDESIANPNYSATSRKFEVNYADGLLTEGVLVDEPGPSTASVYPRNQVLKTGSGIIVELDDSPGAVRVKVFHPSGSYFEINDSGSLIQRTTGKHVEFVSDEKLSSVRGPSTQILQGTQHLQVDKSSVNIYQDSRVVSTEKAEQRYNRATLTHTISGLLDYRVGNFSIQSAGNLDMTAGSDANLGGDSVNIQGQAINMVGTKTMEVTGVGEGVRLVGKSRLPSHKIYASEDIDNILDFIGGVLSGIPPVVPGVTAPPATTPIVDPATFFPWKNAVDAALENIIKAFINNKTVHEASKT